MLVNPSNLTLRPAILRSVACLVCPSCYSDLTTDELIFRVICDGCGINYKVTSKGQINFIDFEIPLTDKLYRSKEKFKQSVNANTYNLLHMILPPLFLFS
jgi:hypothetical protein